MDWSQVNWKTTGYAIGYLACWIFGSIVPNASSLCEVLDKLIIVAGLVSAADSERVKSIVRAVDVIAWKNKIDPATLTPVEPEPVPVPVK